MNTIYKYLVQPGLTWLRLPAGAEFLTVQVQHNEPQMWFQLDPEEKLADKRCFQAVATGEVFESKPTDKYLGTFQLMGGAIVFHLYEV